MDSYAYIAHGHVFANAQTGNVVLFAVNAAAGDWSQALRLARATVDVGRRSSLPAALNVPLRATTVNTRTSFRSST